MGIYHDYLDNRRESDNDIESRIDHTFIVLCVPLDPSDSYYEQVVADWKADLLSYYQAGED